MVCNTNTKALTCAGLGGDIGRRGGAGICISSTLGMGCMCVWGGTGNCKDCEIGWLLLTDLEALKKETV